MTSVHNLKCLIVRSQIGTLEILELGLHVMRVLRRVSCSSAIICLGFGAHSLYAEEVSGIVVSAQTGEPVAGARVSAIPDFFGNKNGRVPPSQIAFTDSGGKFRLTGLEAGRIFIAVQKSGFGGAVDAPVMAEVPSRTSITIRLVSLSTVRGSVRDNAGAPMVGIDVRAIRSGISSGQKTLAWVETVRTNERGEFILPDLFSSKYYLVAVQSAETQGKNFAPVYFPGTTDLDSAKEIELHPGEVFRADLRVAVQPSIHVRGSIKDLASDSPAKLELYRGKLDVAIDHLTFNAPTGQFDIRDVVPGTYLLRATQGDRRAQMDLRIADRDTENLALELSPGVDIPILIQYPPEDVGKVYGPICFVTFFPVDAQGPIFTATLEPNDGKGSMVVRGVLQGRYRVALNSYGRYVASAVSGDRDLLQSHELTVPARAPQPIEIVLKSDGANVSGRVVEGKATDVVLLVPQFPGPLTNGLLSPNGEFSFKNIAPGDYRAYVVATNDDVEYANPDALSKLPGGIAVHVTKAGISDLILRRVLARP